MQAHLKPWVRGEKKNYFKKYNPFTCLLHMAMCNKNSLSTRLKKIIDRTSVPLSVFEIQTRKKSAYVAYTHFACLNILVGLWNHAYLRDPPNYSHFCVLFFFHSLFLKSREVLLLQTITKKKNQNLHFHKIRFCKYFLRDAWFTQQIPERGVRWIIQRSVLFRQVTLHVHECRCCRTRPSTNQKEWSVIAPIWARTHVKQSEQIHTQLISTRRIHCIEARRESSHFEHLLETQRHFIGSQQ